MRPRASLSGLLKAYDDAKTILDNKNVRFRHKSKPEKERPTRSMDTAAERGVLGQQRIGKQGTRGHARSVGTPGRGAPCVHVSVTAGASQDRPVTDEVVTWHK